MKSIRMQGGNRYLMLLCSQFLNFKRKRNRFFEKDLLSSCYPAWIYFNWKIFNRSIVLYGYIMRRSWTSLNVLFFRRIVLVVRDPVRRALSDVVHCRISGLVPENATVESELFLFDEGGVTVREDHHIIRSVKRFLHSSSSLTVVFSSLALATTPST